MEHLFNQQQFRPPGDDDAKAALNEQLKGNFPKEARQWLKSDDVRVDAPTRLDPDSIDWDGYPDWRASRQLGDVKKRAKKIDKGKHKPIVTVRTPGSEKNRIIDGHHGAMGYVDAKENPLAYVVHVPNQKGPWDTFHDQQRDDKHKDDFGKTKKKDQLG